jgi:pimeloyl-ACP methyl ester carboxylesterase
MRARTQDPAQLVTILSRAPLALLAPVPHIGVVNAHYRLLLVAAALILGGGAVASWVQTAGGTVRIEDVRFPGPNGIFQNGRLYIPDSATSDTPAPGVVAIHGYVNSHETQSGYAIELSRRGYVVLAADQTGHGYSDPPSGANGYGGPPALAFLRSLDIVDAENIGLEGHSMGGWASVAAARAMPGAYRSIVLQGAGLGLGGGAAVGSGGPDGEPPPLRNVAVVFSRYDEFAQLMWGVPEARAAGTGERLKAFFSTVEDVVPGRVYGSIDQGTARLLEQPAVTHPGDHISRAAIGDAIEWFGQTLEGGTALPATDQIWYWKELATLAALVGMVVLLLAAGGILLGLPWFAELRGAPAADAGRAEAAPTMSVPPETGGSRRAAWWSAAIVFSVVPAATLFPFKDLVGAWGLTASPLLPQNITTQIALWALLNAAISVAMLLVWRSGTGREEGRHPGWRGIGKSWVLAALVALAAYSALAASDYFFQTDFRFWVFAVKLMSPLHLRIALSYIVPFTVFFLVTATVLHGRLRRGGASARRETLTNMALLAGGFVALLLYQYVPLFLFGALADDGEALWTIIAIQFLPLMAIVGVVSTWFFRRTGHIWVGAFLSAILVTWIVVASQATHWAF